MRAYVFWYEDQQRIKMLKDRTIIDMEIGSTDVTVNGEPETMDVAPLFENGTVMVPVRFIAEKFGREVTWDGENRLVFVGSLPDIDIRPDEKQETEAIQDKETEDKETKDEETGISRSSYSRYRVVIDPGHGGRDPGAIANGLVEKNVNLDIALKLKKILDEKGVSTYMTRSSDVYPNLYYRARMANNINAHLFVSIHNNAGHSRYSGIMTLYCPSSRQGSTGRDFAKIVFDVWSFSVILCILITSLFLITNIPSYEREITQVLKNNGNMVEFNINQIKSSNERFCK